MKQQKPSFPSRCTLFTEDKTMKTILLILAVIVSVLGFILTAAVDGLAKCEQALLKMKIAQEEAETAKDELSKAENKLKEATSRLDASCSHLWALGRSLGATVGSVTREKITLGAPAPKDKVLGKAFYEDKAYRGAKRRWEEDKVEYEDAKRKVDEANAKWQKEKDDYVAAREEYRRLRAEHVAEEKEAEEEAERKIEEIEKIKWVADEEKTVSSKGKKNGEEVVVSAKCTGIDTIKIEILSDPPGSLKTKSAKLRSPEGIVYTPRQKYEKTLVHLGKPVYTSPRRASFDSGAQTGALIGSSFLGGFGRSGGGKSGSSACTATAPESSSGTDYAAMGGSILSAMASQPRRTQAPVGRMRRPVEKTIPLSVVEFKCQPPKDRVKPWCLSLEMEKADGSVMLYMLDLYLGGLTGGSAPVKPPADITWRNIRLTGSDSKFLK
jgi:hypothetical protein